MRPFSFDELPSPVSSPASSYVPERPSRKPLPVAARVTPVVHQRRPVSGFKDRFITPTHNVPSTSSAPVAPSRPCRSVFNCNSSWSRSDVTTPGSDDFEPQEASALVERQSSSLPTMNLGDPWDVLMERMGIKCSPKTSGESVLPLDFAGHPGLPSCDRSGADFRWALCSSMFPTSLPTSLRDASERGARARLFAIEVGQNLNWDGTPILDAEERSKDLHETFDDYDMDWTHNQNPSASLPYPLTAPDPPLDENRPRQEPHNRSYLSESPSPPLFRTSPPPPPETSPEAVDGRHVAVTPSQATTPSSHFVQRLVEGLVSDNLPDDVTCISGGDHLFALLPADDALPSTGADLTETSVSNMLEGLVDGKHAILDVKGRPALSNTFIDGRCSPMVEGWTSEGTTTAHDDFTLYFNGTPRPLREALAMRSTTTPAQASIKHMEGVNHVLTKDTPATILSHIGLSNADGRLLGPSLFDDYDPDDN